MKSFIPSILILIGLISCENRKTVTAPSAKKQLIQQHVMAVLWYQQSAEMTASYLQAYRFARLLLDAKLDTLSDQRPTGIVLDIDETVLDNSPNAVQLIQSDQTFSWDSWKAWTDEARAKSLPGALDFVNYAKGRGVEIYYISNRKEVELGATIQNLQSLNFPNADSAHVFLKTETSDKTIRRAAVAKQVEVLVYLGDNLRDYSELFANRGADFGKKLVLENAEELLNNFVIFPNPTYGEWEKAIYVNDMGIPDSLKLARRAAVLED